MFYSICYDVKDDRRRLKISNILKDYGERVQFSVFEADIDAEQLSRLVKRVKDILNDEEDSLRLYPLCASCVPRIVILGQGIITQDPDVIII